MTEPLPPPSLPPQSTATDEHGTPLEYIQAAQACGFRIMQRLGEGGMASVFLAFDEKLQRRVALKFPSATLRRSPKILTLLKREAEIAASLLHENVVQVYSWNEAHGCLFFAMELVEGETLASRVQRSGPLRPEEAMRIVLECSDGLAAAHRLGIIHHDIKPANVMIRKDGRVKVADLGISTTQEERTKSSDDMGIRGTPGYMAPEQARGEVTTPSADIYSLGATLFFALTGRGPYQDGASKTMMQLLARNQSGTLQDLESALAAVPKDLRKFVRTALAPRPAGRFPNMAVLKKSGERVFLKLETQPSLYVERITRAIRFILSKSRFALSFLGGIGIGAFGCWWYLESTTVPATSLRYAGETVIGRIANEATKIYNADPKNGLIGTAIAPLVKASKTADWPLALHGLDILDRAGMIRIVPPPTNTVVTGLAKDSRLLTPPAAPKK